MHWPQQPEQCPPIGPVQGRVSAQGRRAGTVAPTRSHRGAGTPVVRGARDGRGTVAGAELCRAAQVLEGFFTAKKKHSWNFPQNFLSNWEVFRLLSRKLGKYLKNDYDNFKDVFGKKLIIWNFFLVNYHMYITILKPLWVIGVFFIFITLEIFWLI